MSKKKKPTYKHIPRAAKIMNGRQLLRLLGELDHVKPEDFDSKGRFSAQKAKRNIFRENEERLKRE